MLDCRDSGKVLDPTSSADLFLMTTTIESSTPQKVLFVAGFGRSGSTLLAQALGEVPGFVSVGEVRHIWSRGVIENQLCGCGSPFQECDFWKQTFDVAFPGKSWSELSWIYDLQRRVDGIRYVPRVFWGWARSRAYEHNLSEYVGVLGKLFGALREMTSDATIIDSSKTPMHGRIVMMIPNVQTHVVHLTRDSRAVAFSWMRKKDRPEVHWKKEEMPRYSAVKSSVWWNGANIVSEMLARPAASFLQLQYEEFIRQPQQVLSQILVNTGATTSGEDVLRDGVLHAGVQHTVSGNPGRFKSGPVALKLDDEWRTAFRGGNRWIVDLLTGIWLMRYGYSLRSGS